MKVIRKIVPQERCSKQYLNDLPPSIRRIISEGASNTIPLFDCTCNGSLNDCKTYKFKVRTCYSFDSLHVCTCSLIQEMFCFSEKEKTEMKHMPTMNKREKRQNQRILKEKMKKMNYLQSMIWSITTVITVVEVLCVEKKIVMPDLV